MRRAPALRSQPLWVRVDQNRMKLAIFVAAFVLGSALLLVLALLGVPGSAIGAAAAYLGLASADSYFAGLAVFLAIAFGAFIILGSILAAVQLSNAEDWVTARFRGREPTHDERILLDPVVGDMSIAAGLRTAPRLIVLETDAVNALAIGTRGRPVLGVTTGLLGAVAPEELGAVVATLIARIVAGDILFGTALAALMGPLRAIREVRRRGDDAELAGNALGGCADGCSGDGCGCLVEALGGSDDFGGGCLIALIVSLFVAVTLALTWAAVLTAAWIVTLWGRLLHRTSYEKADAEGMLLLRDPVPMLSALGNAARTSNDIAVGDVSYDGIFYASTSGTSRVEKVERRRLARLAELLGADGAAAFDALNLDSEDS